MRHSITQSSLCAALDLYLDEDEEIFTDPGFVVAISDEIEAVLPNRPHTGAQWWGTSKVASMSDIRNNLGTFRGTASESYMSLAPSFFGDIEPLGIVEGLNFYLSPSNFFAHTQGISLSAKTIGAQHGNVSKSIPLFEFSGEGDLFLAGQGELINRELDSDETLTLASRSLVGFHGTISIEWTRANREGSAGFLGANIPTLRLTGPGLIIYQTRGKYWGGSVS
jgi:uncharacterized protein (AIM24 family)